MQDYVDDILMKAGIEFLRIPDQVWNTLKRVLKPYQVKRCAKFAKGHADNTCFIQITKNYSLCMHIENKSHTGKFTPKQEEKSKILPYRICRTPEKAQEIILDFIKDAKKIKNILESEGF